MIVQWYFDFVSPFAYLQSERLGELPGGTRVEFRPILFAAILNHWGQKGPAEIPSKRRFTYRQALWVARRDGIELQMPPAHPFNPLSALRLAIALDCDPEAVRTIFRFIWAEGMRPDDLDSWSELAGRLDIADANERISAQDIKNKLRSNTEEAIAAGVFGVPTIAVGKELFWGYDMTGMAAAYIGDPQSFADAEMQKAASLPVGVERLR